MAKYLFGGRLRAGALVVGSVLAWGIPALARTADTPVITCNGESMVTITVNVCAPSRDVTDGDPYGTGAPGGFSVQWMSVADYNLYGWSFDSECTPGDPGCPASFCKASFSGTPCTKKTDCVNRFSLDPGQCTDVEIGNLFDEELGLSSSCLEALNCGTDYVFRGFSHEYKATIKRSAFTANLACSTNPCAPPPGCTYTQGFWKTHCGTADGCNANLPDSWPTLPVTSGDNCTAANPGLTLGSRCYTKSELEAILKLAPGTPTPGHTGSNGLVSLAHQLISAKLNIINNADPSSIASVMTSSDALIGALRVPPTGGSTDFLASGATSTYTGALDSYNSGLTGPGHCTDDVIVP